MLVVEEVRIEEIYVPAGLRKDIDAARVEAAAEKILEGAEHPPIQLRRGKGRYVLVRGLHRLEGHKALGDTTIEAYIVHARQH